MADFDLFVIGGGSGGVACSRRAGAYGARVGLAERSRLGGTCVIRGCVPKKIMHFGAHFGEGFGLAKGYGWRFGEEPRLDFEALLEARNREITRLTGIYRGMVERAGVRLYPSEARLLPERAGEAFQIEVGGERVTATRVLVAVGGQPQLPAIPGAELAWTSDEVLERVYPRPGRVVVIGAGYIGVEQASILHGLGSEASLVLRGDLPLRGFDDEMRRHLAVELERTGLRLFPRTDIEAIRRDGQGFIVETSKGHLPADLVMFATGRTSKPNTGSLGLEAHGVHLSEAGHVCVDAQYRSNVEGLLAVGDACDHAGFDLDSGQMNLTPVAIAEGRAVAERLFHDNPMTVAYDTVPTAVFGLPQAASVGLSEERAREAGHDVVIFRTDFRPMLYILPDAQRRTMMKLIVDRATDRVLGCHMVGDDAAEMMQGFAVAMTAGVTKAQLDATVGLHPTAAEELVTMYQPVAG